MEKNRAFCRSHAMRRRLASASPFFSLIFFVFFRSFSSSSSSFSSFFFVFFNPFFSSPFSPPPPSSSFLFSFYFSTSSLLFLLLLLLLDCRPPFISPTRCTVRVANTKHDAASRGSCPCRRSLPRSNVRHAERVEVKFLRDVNAESTHRNIVVST